MSLFVSTGRLLGLAVLSVLTVAFGPVTNEVISAFRSGDAVRISRHLDEVVRITIDGKTHAYGRGQGEMILRNFFADRSVRQFEPDQKGEDRDTEFFAGTLALSDDCRYRLSVYMKERSGRRYITEMLLEL